MNIHLFNQPTIENLSWLGDLLISSLGALIAFYFWNWYHSPFLVATRIEQKEVISRKENRSSRFNTRLYVKNIGRVPARNCKASLWLMGRNIEAGTSDESGTGENLYVISSPLGWANRRASLFADDHKAFSEKKTIAPIETATVELFRQSHTGQFTNSDWVTEGVSIGEIYTDKIGSEVEERLGDDILIAGGRGRGDLYGNISGGIDREDLATTQWEEGEVQVIAENSNSVQQTISMKYEEGQVKTQLCQPEGRLQRLKIQFRQVLP